MDRRLLRYYNQELQYLRELGEEFSREHPKIAERLGLSQFECSDPYVERLLEGFAFLAARVQLKIGAEFPRFTNYLLETIYPHYLAPTPSMAVVQFEADVKDARLAAGFKIPRDTSIKSILGKSDVTSCEYRTAHELKLFPVEVTEARYFVQDLGLLNLPASLGAKAAIRIRLRAGGAMDFSKIAMEELTLYLRGADDLPFNLYEQIIGHATGLVVRPIQNPAPWQNILPPQNITRVGFDAEQALLPFDARSFQGFRLLHEYFAFPHRFLFVELGGLLPSLKKGKEKELDIIIPVNQADLRLDGMISATNIGLNCTPAINLFPKRADRIHVQDRFSEFHVIPDRTRPLDYEVYSVSEVVGYESGSESTRRFEPFYTATDAEGQDAASGAYYAVNRVQRVLSSDTQRMGPRSSYIGSEVFIALVDAASAPYPANVNELGIGTLCTNRDLALRLPVGRSSTDFTLDISAPCNAIRCISGPTAPRPSTAEGETAWRLISHLSLNYLSLMDTSGGQAAGAFRDILQLYRDMSDQAISKQVDGLKTIVSKPIMRRVMAEGPISFARGLEVEVTFDPHHFEGMGVFVIGAVLDQFFARYVSINSFTETVIRTTEKQEIMRWPARTGHRPIL